MRWEYRKLVRTTMSWDALERDLNRLGAAGWELVAVTMGDATLGLNQIAAVLKRPVDGELTPDPTLEDEQLANPGAHFA
jgi:hypothetical protein